jgi:hypothetical protein
VTPPNGIDVPRRVAGSGDAAELQLLTGSTDLTSGS